MKNVEHLTILLAVNAADISNGCMEVVKGSHKMRIPISSDNCIDPNWTETQQWTPVELDVGQILVFGSYLAHKSATNRSSKDRKALYATYNRASDGDHHGRSELPSGFLHISTALFSSVSMNAAKVLESHVSADEYYRQRMVEWPPTHLRKPGQTYEKGQFIHGKFGSSMLRRLSYPSVIFIS